MNPVPRILAAAALLALAVPAFSQPFPITWISGVGDDANPCSRTAPCKTCAGAISKTYAGGEIKILDPGGFGALTITKAITIQGGVGLSGILIAGTNGITVAAGANDVVILRNLDFNGVGISGATPGSAGLNGVEFLSGARLVLDHCRIIGFNQAGVYVASTASGQLVMQDVTIVPAPAGTGVHIAAGATLAASLERVTVQGGVDGIDAASGALQVTDSVLTMATGAGILAEGGTVSAHHCLFTGNATAASARGSRR